MNVEVYANALALRYSNPMHLQIPLNITNNSYTTKWYILKVILPTGEFRSVNKLVIDPGHNVADVFLVTVTPPTPSYPYSKYNMVLRVEEYFGDPDSGGVLASYSETTIPFYILDSGVPAHTVYRPDAPVDPEKMPYFTLASGSCTIRAEPRWANAWLAARFSIGVFMSTNQNWCSIVSEVPTSLGSTNFVILRMSADPFVSRVEIYDDVGWSYIAFPSPAVYLVPPYGYIEVGLPLEVDTVNSIVRLKINVYRATFYEHTCLLVLNWVEWIRV